MPLNKALLSRGTYSDETINMSSSGKTPMDNFNKLTRVRSSAIAGEGNTGISAHSKDWRITSQKTQSFKGGKNRALNWLQRQFSGKRSWSYDATNNDIELVIAVAAAAYSIKDSIQRSSFRDERAGAGNQEISSNKPVKRKEKVSIREPGEESTRHAGEEAVEDAMDEKARGKTISRDPTMKRRPTFAAETSKSSSDIKPESPPMISRPLPSKPDIAEPPVMSAMKPDIIEENTDFKARRSQSVARLPDLPGEKPHSATPTAEQLTLQPVAGSAKADAWEKAEILKIKEQYEKLMRTILTWENKKKTTTRHKLDRIEQELERKRAKASQKYRTDMEYINKVAQGARIKAEERRRNKELEAKEEADKIRATGKVPRTCFCCRI